VAWTWVPVGIIHDAGVLFAHSIGEKSRFDECFYRVVRVGRWKVVLGVGGGKFRDGYLYFFVFLFWRVVIRRGCTFDSLVDSQSLGLADAITAFDTALICALDIIDRAGTGVFP
jgi:hypothetical protein